MEPSEEEMRIAGDLADVRQSAREGILGEGERPIPMPFITGRQSMMAARATAQERTLTERAALAQAERLGALQAAQFTLDTEAAQRTAEREERRPMAVSPGQALVNPVTGERVAEGTAMTEKQSLDTFYSLAQSYPDAGISWNPGLTAQQNLETAQAAAAQSPSFQARNTVYAIDPLTGQPIVVRKAGFGAGQPGAPAGTADGAPVTVDTLQPELRSALMETTGEQYFDKSKVTSGQYPFLQRASQELGIPIIDKDDANKLQIAQKSFASATALVDQVTGLAGAVLTANTRAEQVAQAAKLHMIRAAPSLSVNDDAKLFVSTREAMLSLLTKATGEVGVLTTQDVERIDRALPAYGDSADLALRKSQSFTEVLQSVLTGAVSAYIGTAAVSVSGPPPAQAASDGDDVSFDW